MKKILATLAFCLLGTTAATPIFSSEGLPEQIQKIKVGNYGTFIAGIAAETSNAFIDSNLWVFRHGSEAQKRIKAQFARAILATQFGIETEQEDTFSDKLKVTGKFRLGSKKEARRVDDPVILNILKVCENIAQYALFLNLSGSLHMPDNKKSPVDEIFDLFTTRPPIPVSESAQSTPEVDVNEDLKIGTFTPKNEEFSYLQRIMLVRITLSYYVELLTKINPTFQELRDISTLLQSFENQFKENRLKHIVLPKSDDFSESLAEERGYEYYWDKTNNAINVFRGYLKIHPTTLKEYKPYVLGALPVRLKIIDAFVNYFAKGEQRALKEEGIENAIEILKEKARTNLEIDFKNILPPAENPTNSSALFKEEFFKMEKPAFEQFFFNLVRGNAPTGSMILWCEAQCAKIIVALNEAETIFPVNVKHREEYTAKLEEIKNLLSTWIKPEDFPEEVDMLDVRSRLLGVVLKKSILAKYFESDNIGLFVDHTDKENHCYKSFSMAFNDLTLPISLELFFRSMESNFPKVESQSRMGENSETPLHLSESVDESPEQAEADKKSEVEEFDEWIILPSPAEIEEAAEKDEKDEIDEFDEWVIMPTAIEVTS